MKKLMVLAAGIMFLWAASDAIGAESDGILGVWTTQGGKYKVEIFKCGAAFCGKVVWLAEPEYPAGDEKGMAGKAKVDRNNPEESLRSRPLLGLQMMKGFTYSADNSTWEGGTIYDPDNGKTYKCKITQPNADQLNVRGFIGFSLLGRTEKWVRAETGNN
ncbi:DUF2147 domain-containing protein [Desulfoglaeba alkanexedens]|jgi:uncharacterized protein (DUF2147 family)|uniref:DUF2147 domain-containing protein n=1 Tax=Desulfoglaeba alkanexedens ALDC TaxID=980445 RepID=A0A4P8L5A0_9BACT|nr:DUF2147 domain-containing protein [Desulfoglaeba alkanexedens]QCQ23044.1 DUF2147 domain-containing protein [Desulfoglaeba alkanexedens ALDC]